MQPVCCTGKSLAQAGKSLAQQIGGQQCCIFLGLAGQCNNDCRACWFALAPGAQAPVRQNAATPWLALQAHVEKFLRKVKKVAHEKELKEAQRVTEVNVGAANRFISHALPDLSKAQKRQLREVRCCSPLRPLQCSSHVLVRPALRGAGLDQPCCLNLHSFLERCPAVGASDRHLLKSSAFFAAPLLSSLWRQPLTLQLCLPVGCQIASQAAQRQSGPQIVLTHTCRLGRSVTGCMRRRLAKLGRAVLQTAPKQLAAPMWPKRLRRSWPPS